MVFKAFNYHQLILMNWLKLKSTSLNNKTTSTHSLGISTKTSLHKCFKNNFHEFFLAGFLQAQKNWNDRSWNDHNLKTFLCKSKWTTFFLPHENFLHAHHFLYLHCPLLISLIICTFLYVLQALSSRYVERNSIELHA